MRNQLFVFANVAAKLIAKRTTARGKDGSDR